MVIQQYQDPRLGKYLQYGYWYQEHRSLILRFVRNGLITVVGFIWAILAYSVYNFVLSQNQYDKVLEDLTRENVAVGELQRARAPRPLQISAVAVLPGENQARADFAAFAENANVNWYVEIDYNFIWAGGQTAAETTLILPQTKTVLMSRGATVNGLPSAADLQITAWRWQRLRAAAEKERAAAVRSGIVVASPLARRENGVTSAGYVVKNETIYNWLTPRFAVVLSQAGASVAVGVNEIDELASGGEENFEYRWLQSLPVDLTVEVFPLLNPFAASSYRLPTGGDYAL